MFPSITIQVLSRAVMKSRKQFSLRKLRATFLHWECIAMYVVVAVDNQMYCMPIYLQLGSW